ncbi:MAG: hypothetical protein LBT20_08465 [Clostridiales bacterium]|jgi:hypothetical protein|nr:hypothetical protein [Clostridiales bacterium]
MKTYFERIKRDFILFYTGFYLKHSKSLRKLWAFAAVALILGIISGIANSERFLVENFFHLKSIGAYANAPHFFGTFLLHLAYFALIYIAVINFYCSVAGFITVFFIAFRLGAALSALVAVYGFMGFVNALVVYLPVNLVLLAALTAYLLICIELSGGFKNRGINRCKPSYKAALRHCLYFLPAVALIDLAAFVVIL